MAGYSATPLQRKLGLKPGMRAVLIGAPPDYCGRLGRLPDGVRLLSRPGRDMDFVQLFCRTAAELRRRLPAAVRCIAGAGMVWVSWPKKSSGLQTDLGEADVREAGLAAGLVDVKICAVDDTWSALRFVRRLRDR